MDGKIGIVMEVTEQRDRETIQSLGPAPEGNLLAYDSRTVGLDQRGISSESGHTSGRCEADKFPPGRRKKRQSVSGP